MENGHIQATGRDARGRKQYRYHDRWSQATNWMKFSRLRAFGEVLPGDVFLLCSDDLHGYVAETVTTVLVEVGAEPVDLGSVPSDVEGATAVVDAGRGVLGTPGAHLADRVVHRGLEAVSWSVAVPVGDLVEPDRENCGTPPPVSSARAEADSLTLDHHDAQGGVAT